MQRPHHAAIQSQGMTPRRIVSIGFVAALHIVLIYALMNGLAKRIVQSIPPVIQAQLIETQPQPQQTLRPPPPSLVKPNQPQIAPPPEIDIQTPPPAAAVAAPPAPQASTVPVNALASGLGSTHSTPPYPPDARRLGEQGAVRLKITITIQGTVSDAQVEQSSGYPELDQAAAEWVKAHWRYKPAMQGGVAIVSTTEALVKFDLKNAQ